ncbi:DNA-processing protein DprA [Brevibacillus reuszeri]|uniref:DNA-processing protein DprA n=1 Tax=Brevibacillus reuszeri TaxID=54915 RepID=UPI00289FA94F|nr:DNA-processing protein DprA [Brevibacillus reuszeri]
MQVNLVSERDWLYLLASIPGLGRVKLRMIYERTGSFTAAVKKWDTISCELGLPAVITKAIFDLQKEGAAYIILHERIAKGIQYVCFLDDDFPEQLRHIPDPPLLLFYRGDLQLLHKPAIGVVGSRKPTPYGRASCAHLVKELVQAGLVIISGVAYGIDGEAHETTIKNNGKTVGVLGCGIDQVYPPRHRALYEKIAALGLLISEYPPGTPPVPGLFPERNRIISGLSHGTLVIEAAEKSGSLITADCALEQGKDVFAIPGPIFSSLSAGPHNLIKQGAKLVTRSADILEELGHFFHTKPELGSSRSVNENFLNKEELTIIEVVTHEGIHVDDLVCQLEPDLRKSLHQILFRLEAKGVLVSLAGGYFAKR